MNTSPTLARAPVRRHSGLRLAFFRAVERGAALCCGRAFYRRAFLARGRFVVREETLRVDGLPRGLDGFTIVQLSDLHGGSFMGRGDLAAVVAEVERLAPALCVITGDMITHHWSDALGLVEDCARLRARHGVLAVFGNHDYKDRLEGEIARAYAAAGVRFLRNECVRIDTGDGVLAVVGLEDLEEARDVDLERARAALQPGDVELVLCHNPGGARALARAGCVAVLSGHTHGAQLDLPFLRRLGPRHVGLRLQIGPTRLIVSRGLGVIGFPLRVRAPAEIVVVRLQARAT